MTVQLLVPHTLASYYVLVHVQLQAHHVTKKLQRHRLWVLLKQQSAFWLCELVLTYV